MSFKNFAVSGKSDRMKKDAMAQMTVTRPSRMKIHAHPGFPPTPSMFSIAAASSPPVREGRQVVYESSPRKMDALKAPAIVAEEKNTPTRVPSSFRLYQLDRGISTAILDAVEPDSPGKIEHDARVQSGFCQSQKEAESCGTVSSRCWKEPCM